MTYNKKELPHFMQTAGKITILTALTGVLVFVVAFLFDTGTKQIGRYATATTSSATTTLTVLNTPPAFMMNAREVTDSATTTPTNSGDVLQWTARAVDANNAPYFLLICSTNASPTPNVGTGIGTVPPTCSTGTQRGVSAGTASGAYATVSTTTSEALTENNYWYAWVCDDAAFNPRCNNLAVTGPTSTAQYASPFVVNHRPVLSAFSSNSPVNPGATLTFSSVSTDPDTVGGEDNIYIVACQGANNGFNATTRVCTATNLASTSGSVTANATAAYTLANIVQDNTYTSYGYLVDQHGHVATSTPTAGPTLFTHNFVVNNVAPTLLTGEVEINGGNPITLTEPGNETTGYTLDFIVRDANSCLNSASGAEITGYNVAVYRTNIGTTTCNGTSGAYNPNNCYPSGVATTTWNLSCSEVGSCGGATDGDRVFTCTFPLWFVADPTDAGVNTPASLAATTWSAAVKAYDDDFATSSMVASSIPVELISFTALDLLNGYIAYDALEPGDTMASLTATSSTIALGNTGIDQEIEGESMCPTFSTNALCAVSASSTVPSTMQKFASTTVAYGNPYVITLSSTTPAQVEINVKKSTTTTPQTNGMTYWGISVPSSITLAGAYKGLNTFYALVTEAAEWGAGY